MLNPDGLSRTSFEGLQSVIQFFVYTSAVLHIDAASLHTAVFNWLLEELETYQGAVLIISHDRYFLDQSVSKILELEDGRLRPR